MTVHDANVSSCGKWSSTAKQLEKQLINQRILGPTSNLTKQCFRIICIVTTKVAVPITYNKFRITDTGLFFFLLLHCHNEHELFIF